MTIQELDLRGNSLKVDKVTIGGEDVLAFAQGAAVADAAGGATIDAEARTALNALLAELRTAGIIAT